ncbi:hypothetical protein D6833_07390, partial [Candidatus Parcubacteria bacterium]
MYIIILRSASFLDSRNETSSQTYKNSIPYGLRFVNREMHSLTDPQQLLDHANCFVGILSVSI